jgi:hypothetical protein
MAAAHRLHACDNAATLRGLGFRLCLLPRKCMRTRRPYIAPQSTNSQERLCAEQQSNQHPGKD